jgi:cytochrome P450
MVYHVAAVLEPTRGDAKVREWFEKTMKNDPDQADGTPFTRLDRFVMELFRTINPNAGSFSTVTRLRDVRGSEFPAVLTEHLPASMAPRHWENPSVFDPDRYKAAQLTTDHDEAHCREIGLAHCPFSKDSLPVKDGRSVKLTNSAFGAIHAEVDGQPYPLVDIAGYAPFGFGYRRCAGEYITIELMKEYLRAIWRGKVSFRKLDNQKPERVPVNPHTVLDDDLAFQKAR